eukprot:GCRY01001077.1.p1 GENE.GCRY01001077.1~~GCRY01001077.1.p1  ORF type:complete len:667 (+),score=166.79 GCRY01001077.1:76-2076(+)
MIKSCVSLFSKTSQLTSNSRNFLFYFRPRLFSKMSDPVSKFVTELNAKYAQLHLEKENAFWESYEGLGNSKDESQKKYLAADIKIAEFLKDATNLDQIKQLQDLAPTSGCSKDVEVALNGWKETFSANAVNSEEAKKLSEDILSLEGTLQTKLTEMKLGYEDPEKGFVQCTKVKLASLLSTSENELIAKSAWEALRSIENFVLENGYIEIVKARNKFAKLLGFANFYDYKVRITEHMSYQEVFALLDELKVECEKTAKAALQTVLPEGKTDVSEIEPWQYIRLVRGNLTKELDPYFSFAESVDRWGRTFAALNIDYNQAAVTLDLIDREGKYPNGFCHAPKVSWYEPVSQARHRCRTNISSNCVPAQVGAGERSMRTLLHEGGHAAHFANVNMPAPCFGQEYAPSSVAFAEIQSMFIDSLMGDADWLARYALNKEGQPIPKELIVKKITQAHQFAANGTRSMLAIPYCERAIYEMEESKLTPENILSTLRRIEHEMVFMGNGSARPTLSVPHLLASESAAYYHGYILADMGVEQTRQWAVATYGHFCDNPNIGPALARAYWAPGNSLGCSQMVERLTGSPLSAKAMCAVLSKTVEETVAIQMEKLDKLSTIPPYTGKVKLNADITLTHGNEVIASCDAACSGGGFEAMAQQFKDWLTAYEKQHTDK